MKKISTVAAQQSRKMSEQKLTVGLDLGDRSSWCCVLDEAGAIVRQQKLGTTPKARKEVFGAVPHSRIALETGMHSPWVSRLLSQLGHEVIVAHARNVRLIGESRKKDDRIDAQTLARLARIDPQLLSPVKHRSAKAQADLTVIRARAGLVRARTALVNTARGLAKSYGERLRGCNVRNMNAEKAQGLSPELRTALEPLLAGIESLSERIRECNEGIERLARESYPGVAQAEAGEGGGHIDRVDLPADAGRRASISSEPGCGLLPGAIVKRYLPRQRQLAREALARLTETEEDNLDPNATEEAHAEQETKMEEPIRLWQQRMGAVVAVLRSVEAKRVLDLGCGEGKVLRVLLEEKSFTEIVGMDVSYRSLEIASQRLKLDRMPTKQKERLKLMHGSLMYRDRPADGISR